MRDRDLHRCPVTETRNGRTVRCTLGDTHWPKYPHQHNSMLFAMVTEEVEEANEAPVCGRSWQEPHPLDGSEVFDASTQTWQPATETLGHVCYEARGHGTDHLCWCGVSAAEHAAPLAKVTPIGRPRQTMLRSAA